MFLLVAVVPSPKEKLLHVRLIVCHGYTFFLMLLDYIWSLLSDMHVRFNEAVVFAWDRSRFRYINSTKRALIIAMCKWCKVTLWLWMLDWLFAICISLLHGIMETSQLMLQILQFHDFDLICLVSIYAYLQMCLLDLVPSNLSALSSVESHYVSHE